MCMYLDISVSPVKTYLGDCGGCLLPLPPVTEMSLPPQCEGELTTVQATPCVQ